MTTASTDNYEFVVQQESGDEFKCYLQGILNEYHGVVYPLMRVPESRSFVIRVVDQHGHVVGGAILYTYWGWLEISLLALEKDARGQGIGRRLMGLIEGKAQKEGCTRIRIESFTPLADICVHLTFHQGGRPSGRPCRHSTSCPTSRGPRVGGRLSRRQHRHPVDHAAQPV